MLLLNTYHKSINQIRVVGERPPSRTHSQSVLRAGVAQERVGNTLPIKKFVLPTIFGSVVGSDRYVALGAKF